MGQNAVLPNIVTCRFVSISRCTLPVIPRLTSHKTMDSPKLLIDLSRLPFALVLCRHLSEGEFASVQPTLDSPSRIVVKPKGSYIRIILTVANRSWFV